MAHGLEVRVPFLNKTFVENIFNISIGRIVYFQDRKVSLDNQTTYTRTNSNLIAEMEYKPTENISLISTFLYDTHGKEQKTHYRSCHRSL